MRTAGNVDAGPPGPPRPQAVFNKARDSFVATLADGDRVRFQDLCRSSSPENILQGLKNFNTLSRHRNTLLTKISAFSDGLKPYFRIVDLVVSSHPEWAAIAWGALNLILQVCLLGRSVRLPVPQYLTTMVARRELYEFL